tara:strand:- start:673 stop:1308 length:636 start_codon:yes stop_codon:yes gene_type:complete
MTVLITLTTAGADTGNFSLYSDVSGYTVAFETGVAKSALEAGYVSSLVPTSTSVIRVKSEATCKNYIDITLVVPTTTTTTTTPPTTTTTTTFGIQATIEFSFYDSGSGVIRASMEVVSGVTLDVLSWGGTGIGYSSGGCSGTEDIQTFNDVLGIGATQITTEVWLSGVLSAQNQVGSFAVNGNTINTFAETIVVGGHTYLITQVTNCFATP